MLPRDQVIKVINHEQPDRIPMFGWVRANLSEQITEAFGSVEAFEDKYEFDLSHIFGGPGTYSGDTLQQLRQDLGRAIEPGDLLDVPTNTPDESEAYQGVIDQIRHHKEERGRFVYIQTPGIFEALNGVFGIENHLTYLALYEDDLQQVYQRQAEWNRSFAMNCLDLGIDMIHVSDDWGAQNALLFSPDTWWKLIYPNHKVICDAVKERGAYVSFHSDGNIRQVLDGVVKLGYDVVHPYQESAGMDLQEYKENYRDDFVLMGGLDIQTTLGFGKLDFLKSEIERVLRMFRDGGLIFCTSHFVQNHCTIEELTLAFDTTYELSRSLCGK
ncbi:MAG: uroporphyrinogen decarboxylase family protein [Planctomycetota bacterium]|jgi:uroporphyrinogen decarboxylase|nr:uroporphyrinogen decarboxylase family protein [Planctomycetota bacterium]